MKKLVSLVACLLPLVALADNAIVGNLRPVQGSIETYLVEWESWTQAHDNYANVSWSVAGGTLVGADKHSVVILWDTAPNNQDIVGGIEVYEDLGGQSGSAALDVVNPNASSSKFCEGALGQPAALVDFGSGPNPGPALPVGATTYLYNPSCAISPNEYTRTNSSVACRANWHGIPSDHTPGDSNGYFLMVDANESLGEFYRTTVQGLTSSFRYEFSAWVGNLVNVEVADWQDPSIQFELHSGGTVIASSANITVPFTSQFAWRKVGFMFDLPVGVTSLDVVVVNRHGEHNGNDLVLDDIAFAPCLPPIVASFQSGIVVDKAHVCTRGSVSLHGWWPSSSPYSSPAFQWQRSYDKGDSWHDIPGATSLAASYSEPSAGIFQYRLKAFEAANPYQSMVSNSLTHFVQRMVVEPMREPWLSCNGSSISRLLIPKFSLEFADPFRPQSPSFNWSPGTYLSSTTAQVPTLSLPALGAPPAPTDPPAPAVVHEYMLTVADSVSGCSGAAPQIIEQRNPRKVAVPSAFSPDGNGINDLFRPLNIEDYPGSRFWVFNRWGENIFYSEGRTLLDFSWDGTYQGEHQPVGTYVWRVQLSDCHDNIINGSSGGSLPYGNVTLIR
ncbi:gliding motility-associated C-terminal domain-containing protein [Myxococcus sp. K15C18031901]|uniref:gliding motility-associated C-terminal domain-containing protein n=1 Tax=Myxococcus dinghuensis TaxID=2906761 RepID=UPI0020A82914|nr:gliding motility-associated C-terminal domain-containing protein [Myxococcus dinghuensis]MCP3100362.1 gliding motility-associated C-terminal domain-containing protein [Myxococcus dinghuensis]